MRTGLVLIITFIAHLAFAQETFPVNGVRDDRDKAYAFIHATIVVSPSKAIKNGTLIIGKGKILNAGTGISIPENSVIVDLKGKYIYPSFIDLEAEYGIPKKTIPASVLPQIENNDKTPGSWNQAVTPEFNAFQYFSVDPGKNISWRNAGFGSLLTSRQDGIVRGTSALVLLGDERSNEMTIIRKATANYSFDKGSSTQDYPSSQMGVIALLRQTFYDGEWYARAGFNEETNNALLSLQENRPLPQIISVNDKLEILRADRIGDEFNFQYIIKGGGNEYQRSNEIKATNASLIIPVSFPEIPDVSDPFDAEAITLGELKHWEMAPANAMMLSKNGIRFAFTSSGLKNKNDFLKNVRLTVKYGLSEQEALAALTTVPASYINASMQLGTLETGKIANFLVCTGNIFDDETIICQNWINGIEYKVNDPADREIRGIYSLKTPGKTFRLIISGKTDKAGFSIATEKDTIKASGKYTRENISIQFSNGNDLYRLSGWYREKSFSGKGKLNDAWIDWDAELIKPIPVDTITVKKDTVIVGDVYYPFTAYGWTTPPRQEDILISNATIWTNEVTGILTGYDVLISGGKIRKIAKNIPAGNARIIDADGKILTSGIIDEHSHMGITGAVNEATQSVTSEVRIGDVINSEDITIYRQLAGGVTTSHILHGSANTIGGQTQVIKLRWGSSPEQMKFTQAPPFIKFALGENVKQSNWGENFTVRFPQTRMGVEQILDDAFTRTLEYQAGKRLNPQMTRTVLELEALGEILNHQRFITCHNYIQSEINMMIHIANKYGFTVNTFTHNLEGYKVADKMKAAGSGSGVFSDWWAYKHESFDAIPYNAAILTRAGVLTAVNSDDGEMARRLNQEAAKSIKYGGLTEEEAWKLCTLNPARLLHIDQWVGSIKEGKDADLVLWSDSPLSIYTRVLYTVVDGKIYYDASKEGQTQKSMNEERARIILKISEAQKKGGTAAEMNGSGNE